MSALIVNVLVGTIVIVRGFMTVVIGVEKNLGKSEWS